MELSKSLCSCRKKNYFYSIGGNSSLFGAADEGCHVSIDAGIGMLNPVEKSVPNVLKYTAGFPLDSCGIDDADSLKKKI